MNMYISENIYSLFDINNDIWISILTLSFSSYQLIERMLIHSQLMLNIAFADWIVIFVRESNLIIHWQGFILIT